MRRAPTVSRLLSRAGRERRRASPAPPDHPDRARGDGDSLRALDPPAGGRPGAPRAAGAAVAAGHSFDQSAAFQRLPTALGA
jgi:hypothetical protein